VLEAFKAKIESMFEPRPGEGVIEAREAQLQGT
jgi:hypothetical protein